jgi:sortase A
VSGRPGARRRAGAAAIAVLAAALLARGLWIPAKASLAQALLARAWSQSRASLGQRAPRPWPWADTRPVARLRVPRLGISRIVLAGASGRTLAFAPGHVDGTAAPGTSGNSAIAGHRDTHFAFLRQLRAGDELIVERTDGLEARYRVSEIAVVDRSRTDVLAATEEGRLTLVTCWPFEGPAPGGRERYVVSAVLGAARVARAPRATRQDDATAGRYGQTSRALTSVIAGAGGPG